MKSSTDDYFDPGQPGQEITSWVAEKNPIWSSFNKNNNNNNSLFSFLFSNGQNRKKE